MLNAACYNDVSDDDCHKCLKYGIIARCEINCPYFTMNGRYDEEDKKQIERYKKMMGDDEEEWI